MNYNDLNPKMLLSDPDRYHNALKMSEGSDCSVILNDTTLYDGWYSPHVMLLAYLVGDLTDDIYRKNKEKSLEIYEGGELYWGSLIPKGIPEEKAIEMLKMMVNLGANLKVKNYYGEDLLSWTYANKILSKCRINNEKFMEEVRILCQE